MSVKVLVRGPCLSQSGYGEHARFVLRALRTREDVFDVYIENLSWGRTSWVWEDGDERQWIDQMLMKTIGHRQRQGTYDLSLQVTIPNEWVKAAPINIGCTAGIETTKISPEWIQGTHLMDKIIFVSNFSKEAFVNTVYQVQHPETGEVRDAKAKGPFEVVNYPFRPTEAAEVDFGLEYDFNFLAVAQWSPRKNIENTVRWFIEEFHDQEVGMVLKTSMANNSLIDATMTRNNINNLLSDPKYADRKCKIHFIHGYLKDEEMSALYQDPKVKALVNIAHGEGYGLPMFEMAGYGKPVVTIGWGGQNDFLYVPEKVRGKRKKQLKAKFAEVEFDLAPVQPEAVWGNVIIPEAQWAYADQGSYKMKLRDVHKKYAMHLKRAEALCEHIVENFTEEKMYEQFIDIVGQGLDLTTDEDIDEMYAALFG